MFRTPVFRNPAYAPKGVSTVAQMSGMRKDGKTGRKRAEPPPVLGQLRFRFRRDAYLFSGISMDRSLTAKDAHG